MRVPIQTYMGAGSGKVFSIVAEAQFSPVDIDVVHLTRGEWNPATDRFRLWYMPADGEGSSNSCYLMVRKLDPDGEVVTYVHVMFNLGLRAEDEHAAMFTIGVLSNDEARAKSVLNSMLEVPPAYHRKDELRIVERGWRSDPDALARFSANVHSALAAASAESSGGPVHELKFELPPELKEELQKGMAAWWKRDSQGQSETLGAKK